MKYNNMKHVYYRVVVASVLQMSAILTAERAESRIE